MLGWAFKIILTEDQPVPKCVPKPGIILDRCRIDDTTNLHGPFLERHDTCVVDASALWENKDGKFVWVLYMFS